MLHSADVPITQSALLVVDAQDSFKVGPRWARRNNHDFEKNVGALIGAYRPPVCRCFSFSTPIVTTVSPGTARTSSSWNG